MQTIELKVSDNAVDKIWYFLKNLPKNDVQIVRSKEILGNHTRKHTKKEKKNISDEISIFDKFQLNFDNFKFDREKANAR